VTEVSMFRLYSLRAGYLLLAVGLGFTIWPTLINHSTEWPLMNSVVSSLLAAVSVLAAVGIRYPLQMLPVLLFELVWKTIWLIAVALPLGFANQMDARTWETVKDCLFAAVLIPLIPWRYVAANYLAKSADPWRRTAGPVQPVNRSAGPGPSSGTATA
jgi:hypothetical protein